MIYICMHMKHLMKRMIYLSMKFLTKFNIFMQVNFMKELESSFWDFLQKLLEEIILWYLYYRTDIYAPIHYIICTLMVQ